MREADRRAQRAPRIKELIAKMLNVLHEKEESKEVKVWDKEQKKKKKKKKYIIG